MSGIDGLMIFVLGVAFGLFVGIVAMKLTGDARE